MYKAYVMSVDKRDSRVYVINFRNNLTSPEDVKEVYDEISFVMVPGTYGCLCTGFEDYFDGSTLEFIDKPVGEICGIVNGLVKKSCDINGSMHADWYERYAFASVIQNVSSIQKSVYRAEIFVFDNEDENQTALVNGAVLYKQLLKCDEAGLFSDTYREDDKDFFYMNLEAMNAIIARVDTMEFVELTEETIVDFDEYMKSKVEESEG